MCWKWTWILLRGSMWEGRVIINRLCGRVPYLFINSTEMYEEFACVGDEMSGGRVSRKPIGGDKFFRFSFVCIQSKCNTVANCFSKCIRLRRASLVPNVSKWVWKSVPSISTLTHVKNVRHSMLLIKKLAVCKRRRKISPKVKARLIGSL